MRLPAEAEGDSCMLVKLIACRVPERSRTQFAEAQMRWSELKDVEGFILQLGGWAQESPETALILALWQEKRGYFDFMRERHDDLFERTGQRGTYEAIRISVGVTRDDWLGAEAVQGLVKLIDPGASKAGDAVTWSRSGDGVELRWPGVLSGMLNPPFGFAGEASFSINRAWTIG
ncbi:hypothetical protein B2K_18650 [Paenibacillus mucilaginosus K02]|uniref:DUF4937 domain-containing protein n=2 Tax=Paenibacillus mucilaginosus TaxID=61624 RepID=I0BK15_9BACL|nr:hypothetical protein B2K_18650 [Paenibacillus mucilaginosus K02]